MTETTRSTECRVSGATLMLAFARGSTTWVLGFTTAAAQRPRLRTRAAGDLPALEKEILVATARCGRPLDAPVRSGDEAGRDGLSPRSLREVEAEAVALVCLEALGLQGAEHCRGYIQHWNERCGAEPIPERSAQRIFKAADQILKAGRLAEAGNAS